MDFTPSRDFDRYDQEGRLTTSDCLEITNFLELNHTWADLTMMPAFDRALHERTTNRTETTAVYHTRTDPLRRHVNLPIEVSQPVRNKDALSSLMDGEILEQTHRAQTVKDDINACIAMYLRPGLMAEQF